MDISGYVVLGIVTLLFLYLMPQLIRSRQDVVDSRVDDRFSADLRILATAGKAGHPARPEPADGAPRAYLHRPHLRTGVAEMNRPPALPSRTAPPAAAPAPLRAAPVDPARAAARAAATRRRRAAARRRLVLTLALLAASVGAWTAVALGYALPVGAVVPTVLLAVVLVLGRRAAVAGRRIEQASATRPAAAAAPSSTPAREARPAVAERPVPVAARPVREAATEIIPRVAAPASGLRWHGEPTELVVDEVVEESATVVSTDEARPEPATGSVAAEGSWTPVPVPVPTYTLKPAAPRVEVAPLVVEEPAAEQETPAPQSLDLDAVLNRRRAAGE